MITQEQYGLLKYKADWPRAQRDFLKLNVLYHGFSEGPMTNNIILGDRFNKVGYRQKETPKKSSGSNLYCKIDPALHFSDQTEFWRGSMRDNQAFSTQSQLVSFLILKMLKVPIPRNEKDMRQMSQPYIKRNQGNNSKIISQLTEKV